MPCSEPLASSKKADVKEPVLPALFCLEEGAGEPKCGSLEPSPAASLGAVGFHSPFHALLTQGTGLWRQESGAFQFHARCQWPGPGWPYLLGLLPSRVPAELSFPEKLRGRLLQRQDLQAEGPW